MGVSIFLFILCGFVDLLLLLGVSRLISSQVQLPRVLAASLLGGVYANWCLIPGFHFLGNLFWRLVFLGLRGILAYGLDRSSVRPCVFYALLSMALGGVVDLLGGSNVMSLLLGLGILLVLCFLGLPGELRGRYVPVELLYGPNHMKLTALRDTGNTLQDPITGKSVLVIGADAACKLTGLTREQLRSPVESLGAIPGLRLIPYRTVGQCSGFLLALRIPKVKIGTWQGSSLVAMAPECVGSEYTYQALTGGTL